MAALSLAFTPVFFYAGAGTAIFWVMAASFIVVMAHASFYSIEAVIGDEDAPFDLQMEEVRVLYLVYLSIYSHIYNLDLLCCFFRENTERFILLSQNICLPTGVMIPLGHSTPTLAVLTLVNLLSYIYLGELYS